MKINFISTEDLKSISGGWNGTNSKIFEQLSKVFNLNYIGPVNPKSIASEKLFSKIKRILGLRGNFHFLSDKRLFHIKDIVSEQLDPLADYNFFFGQMVWTKCYFNKPYGVYLDACFPTYLSIYSSPESFDIKDVERIKTLEKEFLLNATNLFFGSYWALHEAEKHYSCKFHNAEIVWVGGNIPIPQVDAYEGGKDFLFISLNFEKKGGYICVEAFQKIKSAYPESTLTIIGQKPPASVLGINGIVYAGLLKKTNLKDFEKFKELLGKAFFLIHPTIMDTMGAVLIESGYYGCPSIVPKSFGIPEFVLDQVTGIVVDTPFNAEDFSQPLLDIIKDKKRYFSLRSEARKYTTSKLTWEVIGQKITDSVKATNLVK
ncbi:glycosyltransferase [Pontibacter ruber]|uniref:Glycosyltransferase n=1 Tax=Pontibacter ruber TaxID=1343895 RepID=A0ABW5CSM0_9BACT|nr:glycosyltransferase [Pontibacter ruber]